MSRQGSMRVGFLFLCIVGICAGDEMFGTFFQFLTPNRNIIAQLYPERGPTDNNTVPIVSHPTDVDRWYGLSCDKQSFFTMRFPIEVACGELLTYHKDGKFDFNSSRTCLNTYTLKGVRDMSMPGTPVVFPSVFDLLVIPTFAGVTGTVLDIGETPYKLAISAFDYDPKAGLYYLLFDDMQEAQLPPTLVIYDENAEKVVKEIPLDDLRTLLGTHHPGDAAILPDSGLLMIVADTKSVTIDVKTGDVKLIHEFKVTRFVNWQFTAVYNGKPIIVLNEEFGANPVHVMYECDVVKGGCTEKTKFHLEHSELNAIAIC